MFHYFVRKSKLCSKRSCYISSLEKLKRYLKRKLSNSGGNDYRNIMLLKLRPASSKFLDLPLKSAEVGRFGSEIKSDMWFAITVAVLRFLFLFFCKPTGGRKRLSSRFGRKRDVHVIAAVCLCCCSRLFGQQKCRCLIVANNQSGAL